MELVLNTYGVSLSKDNEGFLIVSADGRQRIPIEGIDSIQLSKGAQITSDAIILAIENEIDVVFSDNSGNPVGRIWSPRYGSISTIRKGQINFTFSHDAVTWIKDIIRKKLENQQAILLMLEDFSPEASVIKNKAISRIEDYRDKIKSLDGEIVQDIAAHIRGWEGLASKIYFEALSSFLPEEYGFKKREQHPARDIVNALLNYGYGLLYGKIEGALIKAGIDPYIGILHRDDYNRPVLVYDIIEIYRIWIDYIILNLVNQRVITDEYYSVKEDGSVWLERLGRRILIQTVNDYFADIIEVKGVERSRFTQIQLYAHSLAQKLKKY